MRTHEYAEAVTDEILEAAALRTVGAAPVADDRLLRERAALAIAELICPCVTDAEDASEGKPSAIHSALIAEVIARARRLR